MDTSDVVVREKSRLPKKTFFSLILFLLCGFLIYGSYQLWVIFNVADPVPTLSLESYGLNDDVAPADQLTGDITYAVNQVLSVDSEDLPMPKVYIYNVMNDTASLLSVVPLKAAVTDSMNKVIVLASINPGSYDSASMQPHDFDPVTEKVAVLPNQGGYNLRDLSVSPDGTKYAYSYQNEEYPSPDLGALDDWNIAIHTRGTDNVVVIEGAAEPEWGNDSNVITYMKIDGLYQQKFPGGAKKITDLYSPLTIYDDIAVSEKHIVLTKVGPNLISVLELNSASNSSGAATEVRRIVTEDTRYSSPVFSDGATSYAVFATTVTFEDSSTGDLQSVRRSRAELRSISSNKVYDELNIGQGADSLSLNLQNWIK